MNEWVFIEPRLIAFNALAIQELLGSKSTMPPKLQEKLGLPDSDLFRQGACHVFADELMNFLPLGVAQMKRIRVTKQFLSFEAVHVFVERDGMALDVYGAVPENKCLERTQNEWSKPGDPAEVEPFPCRRDDLFPVNGNFCSTEVGWKTPWRLYLDAEFIAACRIRAHEFILKNRSTYGLGQLPDS